MSIDSSQHIYKKYIYNVPQFPIAEHFTIQIHFITKHLYWYLFIFLCMSIYILTNFKKKNDVRQSRILFGTHKWCYVLLFWFSSKMMKQSCFNTTLSYYFKAMFLYCWIQFYSIITTHLTCGLRRIENDLMQINIFIY